MRRAVAFVAALLTLGWVAPNAFQVSPSYFGGLKWRSIGGLLLTTAHLVFAGHFAALVFGLGPTRHSAAAFHVAREQRT